MPEQDDASVLDRHALADELAKQLSYYEEERAGFKHRQCTEVKAGKKYRSDAKVYAAGGKPAKRFDPANPKSEQFKVSPDRILGMSARFAYMQARGADLEGLMRVAVERAIERIVGDGNVLVLRKIDERTAEAVRAVVQRLPDLERIWGREMSEERIERLIADLLPEESGKSGHVEIDNAIARTRFVDEHRCLTSAEVHAISGSSSSNKSMPATRWRADGRIFAVPFRGRDLYPAFQFKDGQPRPVVAKVLASMPPSMTDWEKAFWFVSNNGWIEGAARPVDRLDDENAVVAAAGVLREPNIG